jgi:hypothetical protein
VASAKHLPTTTWRNLPGHGEWVINLKSNSEQVLIRIRGRKGMNNLDLILNMIESGSELSPNLRGWLGGAIRKFKHGVPLDRAFEVSKQRKTEKRNHLIRGYADSIEGKGDWHKAEIILSELRKLRCGRNCSPILEEAEQLSPIPKSQRQIFRIITDN